MIPYLLSLLAVHTSLVLPAIVVGGEADVRLLDGARDVGEDGRVV